MVFITLVHSSGRELTSCIDTDRMDICSIWYGAQLIPHLERKIHTSKEPTEAERKNRWRVGWRGCNCISLCLKRLKFHSKELEVKKSLCTAYRKLWIQIWFGKKGVNCSNRDFFLWSETMTRALELEVMKGQIMLHCLRRYVLLPCTICCAGGTSLPGCLDVLFNSDSCQSSFEGE